MSHTLDRHRMAYKELEEMLGDAETTQLATGAIAELLKTAGTVAAAEQAKKEAAAKTKKEKEEYDLAHKDEVEAGNQAKAARKKANESAIRARTAKAKADAVSSDPRSALQVEANKLATQAALDEADARAAEERYALYHPAAALSSAANDARALRGSGGFPTWGWIAIGTVAAGGFGLLLYKALRRK